jgi:hypothetical protein
MTRLTRSALMRVVAFGPTACVGSKKATNVSTATIGQQLEDLEKAYNRRLLSDAEYDKKRKEILKS